MAGPTSSTVRFLHAAVLVLIALGGAGLAAAADRQHNPIQRPELTRRADGALRPVVDQMAIELSTAEDALSELSLDGRNVLGRLQVLDLLATEEAIAEGEVPAAAVAQAGDRLRTLVADAAGIVEPWRLGQATVAQLEAVERASLAAVAVDDDWVGLAAHARRVAGLVGMLREHDDRVFDATSAGRQAEWDNALGLLDQARSEIVDATMARDELAASGNVATLDDLLSRYRAYDAALVALYEHMRDGGQQSGPEFEVLEEQVAQAQAALPADDAVLSVVVGETAGPVIAAGLVALDEAHGRVNAALELVSGS